MALAIDLLHGIERIPDQIEQHLLDLDPIGDHRYGAVGDRDMKIRPGGLRLFGQQGLGDVQALTQVDRLGAPFLGARPGPEALEYGRCAPRLVDDRVQHRRDCVRFAARRKPPDGLGLGENGGQGLGQLVCHAAGHFAKRIDPRRVAETGFEAAKLGASFCVAHLCSLAQNRAQPDSQKRDQCQGSRHLAGRQELRRAQRDGSFKAKRLGVARKCPSEPRSGIVGAVGEKRRSVRQRQPSCRPGAGPIVGITIQKGCRVDHERKSVAKRVGVRAALDDGIGAWLRRKLKENRCAIGAPGCIAEQAVDIAVRIADLERVASGGKWHEQDAGYPRIKPDDRAGHLPEEVGTALGGGYRNG